MSYCRWSSDFGECDVYVYAHDDGGWTTHVAGRRLKHKVPDAIRQMPNSTPEEWLAVHKAEREWRDSLLSDEFPCSVLGADGTTKPGVFRSPKDSEYVDLSEISPLAGKTFSDPTPQQCAERLKDIRATGLNVPQYAIDELLSEQIETN